VEWLFVKMGSDLIRIVGVAGYYLISGDDCLIQDVDELSIYTKVVATRTGVLEEYICLSRVDRVEKERDDMHMGFFEWDFNDNDVDLTGIDSLRYSAGIKTPWITVPDSR
jgi:hypothetical protein